MLHGALRQRVDEIEGALVHNDIRKAETMASSALHSCLERPESLVISRGPDALLPLWRLITLTAQCKVLRFDAAHGNEQEMIGQDIVRFLPDVFSTLEKKLRAGVVPPAARVLHAQTLRHICAPADALAYLEQSVLPPLLDEAPTVPSPLKLKDVRMSSATLLSAIELYISLSFEAADESENGVRAAEERCVTLLSANCATISDRLRGSRVVVRGAHPQGAVFDLLLSKVEEERDLGLARIQKKMERRAVFTAVTRTDSEQQLMPPSRAWHLQLFSAARKYLPVAGPTIAGVVVAILLLVVAALLRRAATARRLPQVKL